MKIKKMTKKKKKKKKKKSYTKRWKQQLKIKPKKLI